MSTFSIFSQPYNGTQLFNNIGITETNFRDARSSCLSNSRCGGITRIGDTFMLREGTIDTNPITQFVSSGNREYGVTSWSKQTYFINPKNWMRDSTVIYACIFDFYNSIYDYGPYAQMSNINSNSFKLTFNYFLNPITQHSKNIVDTNTVSISSYATLSQVTVQTIKNNIISLMELPTISNENGVFYVTLSLNKNQFYEYKSKTTPVSKNAFITTLLAGLLQDTSAKLIKTNSTPQMGFNPVLTNTLVTGIKIFDLGTYDIYSIQEGEFDILTYQTSFFCTGQVRATIEKWSPMLACLLAKFFTGTLNDAINQKIMQDTGVVLNNYYKTANTNLSKNLIVNNCSTIYIPPLNVSSGFGTSELLLTSSSPSCKCYNSSLTPAGQDNGNDPIAMCFDKNCTDAEIKGFGLSNDFCSTKCSNISSRLLQTGTNRVRNASDLDNQKLFDVCGMVFSPYKDSSINVPVMLNGIYITLTVCIFVYAICNSYGVRGIFITIWIILVFFIGGFITFIMTFYFAGMSSCDENFKQQCLTRVNLGIDSSTPWIRLVKKVNPAVKGGVQIPYPFSTTNDKNPWQKSVDLSFCDPTKMVNCECIIDSDCKDGCTCHSGTCTFRNVPRKTQVTNNSYPNKTLIIFNCVVSVVMMVVLIYMHQKFNWNINMIVFCIIVLLMGFSSIGSSLYFNYKKIQVTNVVGTCKSS